VYIAHVNQPFWEVFPLHYKKIIKERVFFGAKIIRIVKERVIYA